MKSNKVKQWGHKYTRMGYLGNGGNACVVRVVDKDNNEFALKPLHKVHLKSTKKKERFVREIDVMKFKLYNIKGVIPIIDFSKTGFWYVMPLAKNSMAVMKEMNLLQRAEAFLSIAVTLKKIHSMHISHRDIKPANILFYDNNFCFSDFGLCFIEDSKLTDKKDNIGAKFTIAPEMKRNSKNSDPFKADVYSMGKTLWMYLTEREDAFDGTYEPLEKGIGLHYFEQYKKSYIADLEFLLIESTRNNPIERPNMCEFCDILSKWIEIYKTQCISSQQRSELKMIKHYLSPSCEVDSLIITKTEDIVKALNYFKLTPMLNHMLFPCGGGFDFESAEIATEKGCIALHTIQKTIEILKPKRFAFESFDDYQWFYFMLEADNLSPFLANDDVLYEELIEDFPGHYCDATDYVYGVYDYDSGVPLPSNARRIERYCKGKFLIVPKNGYYNHLPSTYDGRHNYIAINDFKDYMQVLKSIADKSEEKGYSFDQIVNALNKLPNPYQSKELSIYTNQFFTNDSVQDDFLNNLVNSLNFKDYLLKINDTYSPALFALYLSNEKLSDDDNILSCFEQQNYWFLCDDGKFKKTNWNDSKVIKINNRVIALSLMSAINKTIDDKYKNLNLKNIGFQSTVCEMKIYREGIPNHIFTKEEIGKLMAAADDRLNNTLVIDEFGYAKIIVNHDKLYAYPVQHETWYSRNNYVGKYSNLSTLDETYEVMLDGWLSYLERRTSIFTDCKTCNMNISELLKSIKRYYKQ